MAEAQMRLREIIRTKEADILKEWKQTLLDTYPQDAVKFIQGQKNQFANPVGHIFDTGLTKCFSNLIFTDDNEGVKESLDEVIRVRAVQDFSPAGALAFIFDLKGIIRAYCLEQIMKEDLLEELWRLDARIDEAVLIAFNIYASCREELAEIRVNEVKSNVYFLLRKAKMLVEESPDKGV
ncbi:hypothetical protein DBT_0286 [Dissulfuribacter thermophilus]|uniref:RsbT co-antagonist protein RsbRD N-terminal domain-containing protein n=1 Tax=Dissulfuribacter thermophilus TaxID=1156395 RepID=A0A1B9F976_9BACT|nr:RsbRD N-terminal domain-containing protein [Dissulfuribacter thermophilus]OCC16469.1 hypothetical protein DBT_0286 [Dissulfuribacter thermophilus]